MALPTLDSTVAGTAANSYVDLHFADDFFGDGLDGGDWLSFSVNDRTRALISATTKDKDGIDMVLRAHGGAWLKYDLVDPEQTLLFPQSGDTDDSGDLEILDEVEEATCRLALHLLKKRRGDFGPIDPGEMRDRGVSSVSSGGLSVSRGSATWTNWPPDVKNLLMGFIQRGGRVMPGGSVRRRLWHEGWLGT